MRRGILLPAFLLASACASPVALRYAPTAPPFGLAATNKPRFFLASVEDRSGGVRVNGPEGRGAPVQGSPGDALRDAVLEEFRRLGLPLADERAKADGVLYAALTEAVVAWSGGVGVPVNAVVRIALKLKNMERAEVWDAELVGRAQTVGRAGGAVGNAPNAAMNLAFAEAVGKIGPSLRDEGVLESFGRAAPRPVAAAPRAPAVSSDLDELPPQTAVRRAAHAVVIGVERYREGLPQADYAARDAKLAAEYFKRVLGVPEENVALLTDDRATRGDFEKYFERWLPNRVAAGDEVYVFYSGHGAPDPAKGTSYLVPFDGDPAYLEQTAYPLKRLYDQLGRLKAKKVFVALDSCFSGAGGRSVLAKGARPLVVSVEEETPTTVTVLSAASGAQISNTYSEKGNGLFTYYFLKGLKELGPDLKAVYGYLGPEVSRAARRDYNADQEPQWREGR
ncbi:caspase family protein [bacterium]|nr:MAG: caspase family protein [bacterium]